jgi:sugar phosphate isomerase/epimerase
MHTKIGIFAKHVSRSTPEELFAAIASFGFNCVQFNAACLGIPSARANNLYLGIEPEVANVVSNAGDAARLISELESDRIKIIFDSANLYRPPVDPRRDRYVITDALSLLGDFVTVATVRISPIR